METMIKREKELGWLNPKFRREFMVNSEVEYPDSEVYWLLLCHTWF